MTKFFQTSTIDSQILKTNDIKFMAKKTFFIFLFSLTLSLSSFIVPTQYDCWACIFFLSQQIIIMIIMMMMMGFHKSYDDNVVVKYHIKNQAKNNWCSFFPISTQVYDFLSLWILIDVFFLFFIFIHHSPISKSNWIEKPNCSSSKEFSCVTISKCINKELFCNQFDDCGMYDDYWFFN